jgi:aspartate/methionine/tyrosine aminotransferase
VGDEMKIPVFKLERYFAQYEFAAPYLLCCSDCESFAVKELLALESGSEKDFLNCWLGYSEAKGNPLLCQELSSLYQHIKPEQILVHAGAEEAIYNFMNAVLDKDDHVIVQYPCYQSMTAIPEAIGCEVTKWEMKQGSGGWLMDMDALKTMIRKDTKAIIINTPHNPTGYTFMTEEIQNIIQLAAENNILLFADEVYKYLEYESQSTTPWICDCYKNAVSLGVMSKSFGLAGLRIGWIATQNKDIYNKMAAYKDYTSICNSAVSEFLAIIALKNKDKIIERNLGIIKSNLILLNQFFNRYRDLFAWHAPKAGPIAFPRFKGGEGIEVFCKQLVEKQGVLLLPGSCYDYQQPHFRIGYGRKNFSECLQQFDYYLRELYKKV